VSKASFLPRPLVLTASTAALLWLVVSAAAHGSSAPGAQQPPPVDLAARGTIRTVVLDPGHGGDDDGAHGAAGTLEKDLVLRFARQLRTALESRFGMRVLLTRDLDVNVSLDARTRFANNNRADLFLSLHANTSVRPDLRGTEVMRINGDDYRERARTLNMRPQPVPVAGGGQRVIDPLPAGVVQLGYLDKSEMLSGTLVRRLTEKNLPGNTPLATTAPLRVLIGANMPAALIELGFLSNADDETALNGADVPAQLVDAIVEAIGDVRLGFPLPPGARR
jgi:N-acetylmuramoyl-L-alanine amidase